jgi:hypothetical protein
VAPLPPLALLQPIPATVGIPLIVIAFDDQKALSPEGSLTGVPIPEAPVVVFLMSVNAVLIQSVCMEEAALTVLSTVADEPDDSLKKNTAFKVECSALEGIENNTLSITSNK